MTYHVQFIEEGTTHVEGCDAPNAGSAFAKCLKLHPGAELQKSAGIEWERSHSSTVRFSDGGKEEST